MTRREFTRYAACGFLYVLSISCRDEVREAKKKDSSHDRINIENWKSGKEQINSIIRIPFRARSVLWINNHHSSQTDILLPAPADLHYNILIEVHDKNALRSYASNSRRSRPLRFIEALPEKFDHAFFEISDELKGVMFKPGWAGRVAIDYDSGLIFVDAYSR